MLLVFGIPLVVVIPVLVGIMKRSLFEWLGVEAMFGGLYLFIAAKLLRWAKKKKAWEKIAAKTGLNYQKRGLSPSMWGDYRKHHVEIYLGSKDEGQITGYCVQFENPEEIVMHLYKESLYSKIGRRLSVQEQDIKVNDPEFDQKFVIKGNRPLSLQAILDPSIRNKIMNTKDFHILIDEKQPNVAHYWENGFVTNTERLRSVLDLMIDIVEKIEAYTPSV